MAMKKLLSELEPWGKNPRKILDHDFARLKEQIIRLGVYKPLLITDENIIIGGNMRFRALAELGVEQVECTVVTIIERDGVWYSKLEGQPDLLGTTFASKDQAMLEYALSDNDSAGYTETDKLVGLLQSLPKLDEVPVQQYTVYPLPGHNVASILESLKPAPDVPTEPVAKTKKMCVCPHCGEEHEFTKPGDE